MADVLIVCVREDEPQAKALADMFEAAGFSIGGAPSNDGALRSSGAGIVVWSQASIRSRPFLDAAQRVINAGKAVVASLIEPPPPSSIGSSPAFDLSGWDGDPNDPALDPLFFAVDRMVNSARAAVGGGAATQEEEYEPPPPRAAPVSARSTPAPRRGGPSVEHLGAEAELWRSIRESREPADFMDYLARYGPDGAFADVAELRLKQLTDAPRAPARSAAPAPASRPMAPRPAARMEPQAPRRAEAPRRMEVTVAAPPRRPPAERGFDRAELHEPPRADGGGLRAFVLIALLGGAAVAGLYFGGGIPGIGAPSPEDQTAEVSAPPALDGAVQAAPLDSAEPDSFSLSDAAAPRPTQTAARREPRPPVENPDEPPPTPVTSWGVGGPASLLPSAQPAATTPNTIIPLTPPATPPTDIAVTAPPVTARVPVATVGWAQRPSARRVAELYPDRAARAGVGGRVQLDCTVQGNLAVACAIATETPAGMGFGAAALSASTAYRAQPNLSNGVSAIGAHARIGMNFQPPSE
jgi:protein TonB